MIVRITAVKRYQFFELVINAEFARVNQQINPVTGRMPAIRSEEENQIRKLRLRIKMGTPPGRGGA